MNKHNKNIYIFMINKKFLNTTGGLCRTIVGNYSKEGTFHYLFSDVFNATVMIIEYE